MKQNDRKANTTNCSSTKNNNDLNGNYLPYLKELQYMFDNFGRSTGTHLYNIPLIVNHIKHTCLLPKAQGLVGRNITIYCPS